VAKAFSETNTLHSVDPFEIDEFLSRRDEVLSRIIASQKARWSPESNENAIWGLVRIVIAQQVSTKSARTVWERVRSRYPKLPTGCCVEQVEVPVLRSCGLSPRKATCCGEIANNASQILSAVAMGQTWEEVLGDIRGIGPWTLAVFRILILREVNILPSGDLGLVRAIALHYGAAADLEKLSEKWSPYRAVACWYLWRSLGNQPLG
jgi:DNA-3-methyladenine glycosylase II